MRGHANNDRRRKKSSTFAVKNKKGGTGLGLAIAKKVVEAHGGTISCRSDKELGTEFLITVPYHLDSESSTISIATNSNEYLFSNTHSSHKNDYVVDTEFDQLKKSDLVIWCLDDEGIYLDNIKSQLVSISEFLSYRKFLNPEDFVSEFKRNTRIDCIILDIDLGRGQLSGLNVCKTLREFGYRGIICIHSNRSEADFATQAMEAGASLFVPKPMSMKRLTELLSLVSENTKNLPVSNDRFLLFEDESIYQRQWKRVIESDNIDIFSSLKEFKEKHGEAVSIDKYSYIVIDYYLAGNETGIDVAKRLREIGWIGAIYLSSNLTEIPDQAIDIFTKLVPKDPKLALKVIHE